MAMIQRREAEAAAKAAEPVVPAEPKKLSTDNYTGTTGKGLAIDKDALKTRQIQRQGCWQAAASNPNLIGYAADLEALKQVVRELAEDGIRFINEQDK